MARQRPTHIPTPHVRPRGVPGLVMGPCIVDIDLIVIRDVQYQFEVNGCRNEEVNMDKLKIPNSALWHIRYAHSHHVSKFQGSSAYSVGGNKGQDGHMAEKTTK
ncbi:hypothetical protein DPMN_112534 [Dreissena polymorpha]|uniref:Uncharacterized protein n=1 Tax=Dreissena polymorpha TaxID=45954 RepID=A0A9D4KH91_DREPO|nr:hypothetical protein DPMN_112534 [Dreissena polymorpha]